MGWDDCGAMSVGEWNRKCGVKQVDAIKVDIVKGSKSNFHFEDIAKLIFLVFALHQSK